MNDPFPQLVRAVWYTPCIITSAQSVVTGALHINHKLALQSGDIHKTTPKHQPHTMSTIWKHYRPTLLADLLAGLTGAVAGAPQAMGFAIIAGISPVYGLYSAFIVTIVAAFTTSSAFLTVAPSNALALVVASVLMRVSESDTLNVQYMFVLTLLVGVFQLGFGLFRLGNLTRFVSNAVMTGFITGAGLLIILGQLDHITGFESPTRGGILAQFEYWLTHLSQTDIQTLIIGVMAIVIIATLHHTRFKRIATLTAIIITSTLVLVLGWDGVQRVSDMGSIPGTLPPFTLPNLSYAPELLSVALAMAVLALVQSAAITSSVAEPDGSTADTTRDFIGQGLANIAGSLFQGMPSGGSISRTAVNIAAGAKTRLANIFAGLWVAVLVLFFRQWIEQVTLAALAGHLVVAAAGLIRLDSIRLAWQVSWMGRLPMVITLLSTLILPLEYSIYLGVILSLGLYVYTSASNIKITQLVRTTDNHYREMPVPTTLPSDSLTLLSVHGNLYFAAAKKLEELLPSPGTGHHSVVIVRLRDNQYLGSTGIRLFEKYARQLHDHDSKLILAGVSQTVRDQMERTGAIQIFGRDNVFYAEDVVFSATEHALEYAENWLKHHHNT